MPDNERNGTHYARVAKQSGMLNSGGETNFNALLFGYKHGYDGCFYNLGSYGTYWSSTEYTKDSLYWTRTFTDIDQLLRGQTYKEYALPIRCVKD